MPKVQTAISKPPCTRWALAALQSFVGIELLDMREALPNGHGAASAQGEMPHYYIDVVGCRSAEFVRRAHGPRGLAHGT
jgi:hypothetical protein